MVVKSHYKKIINECWESMIKLNGRLMMLEERRLRCFYCHDGSLLQKASQNISLLEMPVTTTLSLAWSVKMAVSVKTSRVDDTLLYRQTNELKCIHDAIGT
ncbi:hypothetical protein MKW98_006516 [Papaver atlanticum]|uniref:Uncharacterized protein n=1 Tax=Papaver atlanticum TaxID=357466 RepID=A0AAD4T9D9_9MAGN|nr:hypothetical protein MKW98_006516 [Papaver atlanticum]